MFTCGACKQSFPGEPRGGVNTPAGEVVLCGAIACFEFAIIQAVPASVMEAASNPTEAPTPMYPTNDPDFGDGIPFPPMPSPHMHAHHRSPSMRPPTELRAVPTPLADALRAEFRRLVDAPDFLEHLVELEGLTRSTHQLVSTIAVTPEMLHGRVGRFHGALGPAYGAVPPYVVAGPEQFGARAIRELVHMGPDIAGKVAAALRQSPTSIVDAIAAAKDKGLTELAAKLEARLLAAIEDAKADGTFSPIVTPEDVTPGVVTPEVDVVYGGGPARDGQAPRPTPTNGAAAPSAAKVQP